MHRDVLSSFLQTDAWLTHTHGIRDAAGNTFTSQSLPGGSYYICTRCFIPDNWTLPDFTKKAWFLRVQPDSMESYNNILAATKQFNHKPAFAIQPQQTLILDLAQSDQQLLAGMKPKHRYNIKVAEKNGVTTEFLTQNLSNEFPRFWDLLSNTADRHTFRTHSESHYRSIIENLEPKENVALCFARHNGKDVAAFMIIIEGPVGTYLHGGSNYDDRNLMAPYLLHWHVMQELKKRGATTYDFWGVHVKDGEAIQGHPSSGTTRFKLGFGGTIVEYPPTFDIILNPFCYTLYSLVQRSRRQKRAFA